MKSRKKTPPPHFKPHLLHFYQSKSSFLPNITTNAIFFCDDDDDEALSLPLLLLRRRRPLFRASAFFVSVEETDDARFLSKRERVRENRRAVCDILSFKNQRREKGICWTEKELFGLRPTTPIHV